MKSHSPAHTTVAAPNSLSLSRKVSLFGLIANLLFGGIFLFQRQQDVGQLPTLIANFFHSLATQKIFSGQAVFNHLLGMLIVSVLACSWLGVGAVITRFVIKAEISTSKALQLTWHCAIGASLTSLLWFGLGIMKLYRPATALVVTLGGLACGIIELHKLVKFIRVRDASKSNRLPIGTLIFIGLPIGLAFISALAPITGKDAMVYRLAVPQAYLAAGGLTDVGTNIFSHLSFGAELNGLWAMLLGNFFSPETAESAFALVAFAWFPLLIVATYGIAKELIGDRNWALCAAGLIAAVPTMFQVAASAYVDHTLALFITLAIYAAGKWWIVANRTNAVYLALALSGALAIKFLALFAIIAMFLLILFKARQDQQQANRVLLSGISLLSLAGLLASPWYLRTWIKTGSPVFPFYAHLWKGNALGWDAGRSHLAQILLSQYGGENKNLLDFLLTPFSLSFRAQPEIPANFDGVLGITLLLGLPLIAWGLWKLSLRSELKIAAFIAGGWYFCWLFTSEQLRFLLPALPALAILLVAIAAQISLKAEKQASFLRGVVLSSALPGLLTIGAWFLEQNPVRSALGGESRENYLVRRLEYYPYYQLINQTLPPDAKIWLINMRNDAIHLARPFFADYVFEDYTISEEVRAANDVAQLHARIQQMGITHLLVRHDVLLDEARTPIVDERKSPAENQAKLKLLHDFLAGEKILRIDARYMLIALK